jgi:formate hydrogenlyase subunit 4
MAGGRSMISFEGDFVLFAYLLAAGRFAGALAALDTGSSFAGMGSAREVLFSALAEPAFFAAAGTLALLGGTASFSSLFAAISGGATAPAISLALCAAAFFLVLLVEGSRLPVDDPTTHLELTMVHEAMILDYSGPDLAFIQYSVAVKMLAFACLAAAALVSPIAFAAPAARDAAFFALVAAQAMAVAAIESIFARLRMTHVPQFILLAAAIALIALAVALLPVAGGRP